MGGQEEPCCLGRGGMAANRRFFALSVSHVARCRRPSVDGGGYRVVSCPTSPRHLAEPPLPIHYLAMGWDSFRSDDGGCRPGHERLRVASEAWDGDPKTCWIV